MPNELYATGAHIADAFLGTPASRSEVAGRVAQTDYLLTKAMEARKQAMARDQFRETLTKAGVPAEQASVLSTAFAAGYNPQQASGYQLDQQELGFRGDAATRAQAGDFTGANAALMGVANGPQALADIQDGMLLANRFAEGGGSVTPTPLGTARIGAEEALATQRTASAGAHDARAALSNRTDPNRSRGSSKLELDPTVDFPDLAKAFGATTSSTYRDSKHNRAVGGVPNSQHLRGTAGDFVLAPTRKDAFIAEARTRGYEVIDEGDHVHVELPRGAKAAHSFVPGEMAVPRGKAFANVRSGLDTGSLGAAFKADNSVLTEAKNAIARGAPREAVIQRLRERGYASIVGQL